ncbi:MAG: hypothetical protein ACPGUV_05560, partial [Polyangiales bacterium]
AATDGTLLWVQHAHRTYAASSGGRNAYITALDLKRGTLVWRSPPLVANAESFVRHGGTLISGYGFTSEKDYLYVLSERSGKVLKRVPVASGPSYLIKKDGKLFVRTYDTDYIFAL